MPKRILPLILKYIIISLGVLILANGILLCAFSPFHIGILLTLLLGFFLLVCGLLWKTILKTIPKWLGYTILSCFLVLTIIISSFYLYGKNDTVTYREDVLIVLGAGIKKEEISKELQQRLDTAVRYYRRNPDVLIVVSGGQGPGEDITEALAMQRYLLKCGVPEAQILREERSTSTKENFVFTKKLLDSHFVDKKYRIAFVTSDFHIFRAERLATHAGFANPTYLHSNTPPRTVLPNGLRECLAILKLWLLDT